MTQPVTNPYRSGRDKSGFTQEAAAELLNVSPRQLHRYESGELSAPDDIALRMAKLYKDPTLVYYHLRMTSAAAAEFLPDIEFDDLPMTYTHARRQWRRIGALLDDIEDMVADGKIDADEAAKWNADISPEVNGMIASCIAIECAVRNGGRK